MALRTIICPSCEHYGPDANCEACFGKGAIKVRTEYVRPPIPCRDNDWSAVTDNYEPGHPVGMGAREADAIDDLLGQIGA